jgi:pimeloyl-ACP methyl ester carboxylesterase
MGFQGNQAVTGWGPHRIADAWVTLMKRLGYEKFLAQGGDWGGLITDVMAQSRPKVYLAWQRIFLARFPVEINNATFSGLPAPDSLFGLFLQARFIRFHYGFTPSNITCNGRFPRWTGRYVS